MYVHFIGQGSTGCGMKLSCEDINKIYKWFKPTVKLY